MDVTENVLEIRDLVKDFPGVRAVNHVSFDIKRNTVHCLVGKNGAGKSTLIKILTGAYPRTSGQILLNGMDYNPRSTRDAKQQGISTLFQELNVVNQLTVEENLTLGTEATTLGFIRKTDKINRMVSVLNSIEPSIKPGQLVSSLSVAKKQLVEIAKAVAAEANIIIMDEPTAAISESEIARLFTIIKNLREQNVTVIYISHRLDEIFEIGDYVTVMRDGKHVDTKPVAEIQNRSELIKLMIGKTVFEQYTPRERDRSDAILEVKHLSNHRLNDISFEVQAGEIAGFYGLVGAGKTELARAIFGADGYTGEILFKGKRLKPTPDKAIAAGITLVPEERRSQGLFTILTIRSNIPVMRMKGISRYGFVNDTAERTAALEYVDKLNVATNTIEKETAKLSGGNQQKVVLSKCLFAQSDLLLMDEPTRGIDVRAKSEIYSIIRQLSREGKTIIIFSSELPEVLNICDQIHLLYDGSLKLTLRNGADIDGEQILHIVTGGGIAVETNQVQKPLAGGKLSDESFITLFMVSVLILVFVAASLVVPNFYKPQNIVNLISNNWFIITVGIGITFIMITGNYDMSIGGNIALTGVLSVWFCQGINVSQNSLANGLGLPYVAAIGLALVCAMAVGALNAFFIAGLKFPSIIVTLGTAMLARGAAQVITEGAQRNTSLPDAFGVLGSAGIPGTTIRLPVLIMITLIIIAYIFEKKTVFARRIYLIGANPEAARLSGINVAKYLTALYIVSGLLAGIVGVLLASEFKAGVSSRATGYEFDALVVVLLGGVSIAGGFGSVLGMVVGALILSIVTTAATGLLFSPDWQFILKAVVTFIAIVAQRYALDRRKG